MKNIIRKTIALLSGRERRRLALLTVLNALMSLADIAALALLLLIVNHYMQPAGKDWLSALWPDEPSLLPVSVLLLLFIIKNACGYLVYRAQSSFVYQAASRLSREGLMRYFDGSYPDYVHTDSSVYARQISHHPIEFAHYVLSGLQQMFAEAVLALIAIVAILLFNAQLFFILLLFLLPPVVLSSCFTRRRLRSARRQVKGYSEKAAQYLQEALSGYVESNLYDRKQFFTDRYVRYQQQLNAHLSDLQVVQWAPSRLVEVFAILGLFILVLVNRHTGGAASVINVGAFVAAAYKIIPGIVRIANLGAQVKTYAFTLDDLLPLPAGKAAVAAVAAPVTSIAFRSVSFAHAANSVLQDFSMEVRSGDFMEVVAPSGKGKTTMIHLLLGLLRPDSGDVLVNGVVADAAMLRAHWPQIAYVKQQPFLLHDTLQRNITLQEEHCDAARLQQAMTIAGLEALSAEGADKIITDSGRNISGGQRQRIALARALYKEASLLILDEPFSELDELAEHRLLAHFRSIADSGKMVILITHNRISQAYCNKTISLP